MKSPHITNEANQTMSWSSCLCAHGQQYFKIFFSHKIIGTSRREPRLNSMFKDDTLFFFFSGFTVQCKQFLIKFCMCSGKIICRSVLAEGPSDVKIRFGLPSRFHSSTFQHANFTWLQEPPHSDLQFEVTSGLRQLAVKGHMSTNDCCTQICPNRSEMSLQSVIIKLRF